MVDFQMTRTSQKKQVTEVRVPLRRETRRMEDRVEGTSLLSYSL